MGKIFARGALILSAAMVIVGCNSLAATDGSSASDGAGISARGAIGVVAADALGPMYEEGGGAEIRLAVLTPEVQGAAPEYLPVYTQGLLNNNFKKYSAVTLIDRQNLEKIIAEQDLTAKGRFSDTDFVKIGGLTNANCFLLGTIQKLSGDQYALHLTVTGSSSGDIKADFMRTGSLARLENGALISEASADLLSQLGVRLTDAGRASLLAGSAAAARAQTNLAKGITAQAGGEEVEALFNFTQAAAFDPSGLEALARLSQLSSSISGGSLSERIMNDIQARDRWLAVFKETARFYSEHPPFEITFDPALIQEGETDYAKRRVNLAMRLSLSPSEAGFAALNVLVEGLEKTGKRKPWGFDGWPLLDITPQTPEAVVFGGKRSFSFKVDIELLNDKGKSLGKGSVTLNSGIAPFSSGGTNVAASEGDFTLARFPKVKTDDLTPALTISITAVNGIPARKLNAAGYMKIDAGSLDEASRQMVRIQGGTFTMGSPSSEKDRYDWEGPQHQVTVSSFYLGKYEVTQKEWQEVMGSNPSYFKGDTLPVEQVSWYDAIEYCNKRSQREGLTPAYTIDKSRSDPNNKAPTSGEKSWEYDPVRWTVRWNRNANGYRLPTEAEWEYACRAGTTTPYYTGSSVDNAGWYDGNSGDTTHPVGQKQANAWGLYDMHGNVWEWCWDWYGSYSSGSQTDPVGASSGANRVWRGGSWSASAGNARSA